MGDAVVRWSHDARRKTHRPAEIQGEVTRMRLKTLLTTTACVAAIGGIGVAPAAAKDGNGKIRRCEVGAKKKFKCETTTDVVITGQCPTGYDVVTAMSVSVDADLNGDGLVCSSPTLGAVDDQLL